MSEHAALPGLDHYAMKSMDYGQLTGLAIGAHAISDCFLLMHVGVGCKDKATAHLLVHDWKEHANLREGWTEVGDRDLILGASDRAGPYLRSWYKRMEPGVMVCTSVTFLDLAGEDLPDKLEAAAEDVPCPVLYIKAPGYEPDLYAGYAKLVLAIAQQVPWKQAATKPDEVTLLGYLFDRYEGDHQGNLQQLRGLLKMVGLNLGRTLFSGQPYADHLDAWTAGHVIELPYTLPVRKKLKRLLRGREPIVTDLPMGIRGSSRWVRTVAEAVGADLRKVEAQITSREAYVWKQVETMLDRWRSRGVAVIAEPPLAAGLCSLLIELGLRPVYVGLRGETLGGARALREALERDGFALDEGTVVVENPSLYGLRESMLALLREGVLDGVFGSATELNTLTSLAPKEYLREHVIGRVEPQGPFFVEIGFPCRDFHAMLPMPYLGYGGVVVLGQRIVDARRVWDAGRGMTYQL
jgi:nitrogenase molybdenum-iron protein alpha/beta subunit